MKNITTGAKNKFGGSASELKNPLALSVCAMLLAVNIVLSYFGNVSITFLGTNVIKLTFTAIPIAIAAMLYGPVPAGIIGGLTDIIGFVLAPMGAYIPGFTISMILMGFVYGAAFYHEKITLARILVTQAVVAVVISELIGSLWFVLFYGFQPLHALYIRGIKEIVMYPIIAAMFFVVANVLQKLPEFKRLRKASKASR